MNYSHAFYQNIDLKKTYEDERIVINTISIIGQLETFIPVNSNIHKN
ncbi:hypothetical protein [Halarcobacter sp.]|nr:hypothetical protein [Halarcobacter sp.]